MIRVRTIDVYILVIVYLALGILIGWAIFS